MSEPRTVVLHADQEVLDAIEQEVQRRIRGELEAMVPVVFERNIMGIPWEIQPKEYQDRFIADCLAKYYRRQKEGK